MSERATTLNSGRITAKRQEDKPDFWSLPLKGRIYLLSVFTAGLLIYAFTLPKIELNFVIFGIALGFVSGIVGSIKVFDPQIEMETSGTPIRVTVSFGIARRDDDTERVKDLIDRADKALYHAKESGRNCIGVYKDTKILCLTAPFSLPVDHEIFEESTAAFTG